MAQDWHAYDRGPNEEQEWTLLTDRLPHAPLLNSQGPWENLQEVKLFSPLTHSGAPNCLPCKLPPNQ